MKPLPGVHSDNSRFLLPARGAIVPALLGVMAGLWEASLLYFRPRLSTLHAAEAGWVIWFLAPLVNALLFGLLGYLVARAFLWVKPLRNSAGVLAFGCMTGLLGAHAAWTYSLSREWVGNLTAIEDWTDPIQGLVVGLAAGLTLGRIAERRGYNWLHAAARTGPIWTKALVVLTLLLALGVGAHSIRSQAYAPARNPVPPGSKKKPNIVLITLDAARADHFSSYGYHRPTTPNIDRLAARGALFENAIAPSSWTLPSHASIMSGLLPHQHGADEGLPASMPVWNIAEILKDRGYETAGFNSNTLYGQAAWGLSAGFETYDDYRGSLNYNLALTVAGRTLVQPVYERFVRYDVFCRRSAQDLSDSVLRWKGSRSRSTKPFFLFVHFFEPHDTYLPPAPYDRRFGRMSNALARRVSFGHGIAPERPFTADEERDIIAAYDNGLAYADEQIGRLLRSIDESPDKDNTTIIITSDHGEAFGEHGSYGHGWTLYRELLHVPLIIAGPGIPSALRISHVASTREIFPTVMELTLGERFPFNRSTLRRHWNPAFLPDAYDKGVTSELSSGFQTLGKPPAISLVTSEWHYIHHATGRQELYRWPSDPGEKVDLSTQAEFQEVFHKVQGQLIARVRNSVRPWSAPHYLQALDQPGFSFLRELAFAPSTDLAPSTPGPRVGMSQAFFPRDTSKSPEKRIRSEEDLLRTLPYH